MTSLFWKSQSPDIFAYSLVTMNLAEFKYFDARLDRELETACQFGVPDLQDFRSTMSVLHDVGQDNSYFSRDQGFSVSEHADSLGQLLDKSLSVRLSLVKQLVARRMLLRARLDSMRVAWMAELRHGKREHLGKLDTLMRIRSGEVLQADHDSSAFGAILSENQRQQSAFAELRQSRTQLLADELITEYRTKMHEHMLLKEHITQAFYILSLLSILIVLVLVARIFR